MPTRPRRIAQVFAAHSDSLMLLPGVVGVGIGQCGDAPCIKVMAAYSSPELTARLPRRLEGYAVELQVTGLITARAPSEANMAFTLISPAFAAGAAIPAKHTCDGPDLSPALAWSGAPPAAKTFALIVDDPDAPAGTWVHWVLFNQTATLDALPENVPRTETLPQLGGTFQGRNDFGKPVERRLVRSGGNPVNAGWWLVLVTAVVGLVVLALSRWVMGLARDVNFAAHGGARGVYVLIVVWGYYLLVGALIVRIVGSWFGMFQYNRWIRPAYLLTDWLVRPIRRILPPFSGWDWSPLAAWLVLWVAKLALLKIVP